HTSLPTANYTRSLHDALPISKRLVSLQLYSNKSLAVDLSRGADGSFGFKLAPGATEDDDERVSSLPGSAPPPSAGPGARSVVPRSEEHTSELQSRENLVCRLL